MTPPPAGEPRSEKDLLIASRAFTDEDRTKGWVATFSSLALLAAERVLIEADMSRKKRGAVIDQTAAAFILQGALDALNFQN